eukprot:6147936-Prymnesium_polylepis.1
MERFRERCRFVVREITTLNSRRPASPAARGRHQRPGSCCEWFGHSGTLPCSSASEASAELLAVQSPPHDVCTQYCEQLPSWAHAAAAFDHGSGQRPPNVTRRRSTPT